jgi:hypothetical protein
MAIRIIRFIRIITILKVFRVGWVRRVILLLFGV